MPAFFHDGAKSVKLFGDEIAVNAEITALAGISGHADKAGLLDWLNQMQPKPGMVFVNHGDDDACKEFTQCLRSEHGYHAYAPYSGTEFDLASGSFVYEAQPKPIVRESIKTTTKQRRTSPAYQRLVQALEALTQLIRAAEGRPNKVLNALADAIEKLVKNYR